jgi:hypothetical protein
MRALRAAVHDAVEMRDSACAIARASAGTGGAAAAALALEG